jgi:hypothetical protein
MASTVHPHARLSPIGAFGFRSRAVTWRCSGLRKPVFATMLLLATGALLAGSLGTASAFPTLTSRCSSCHSGPALTPIATQTALTATAGTYTLSASGASYIAVFDGTTKVTQITGASGSVSLPVGKTYTLYAVAGPTDVTGFGQGSVTVTAPVGDTTAPNTTSNAAATYVGSAAITLTAADNAGGSGVAATYYRLNGGTQTTGTSVSATAVGSYTLEFWSVDVAGNIETPHKTAAFTVTAPVPDLTPPTTTSDAKPSYVGSALIKLSAVDTGGSGVAATYYVLDGGTQTTGTSVLVSSAGTHTIEFWSVDVAGNIETPHNTVTFIVTAPVGKARVGLTIRASASRIRTRHAFLLQGEITAASPGDRVVVYVKRPGSARWSMSSTRGVYFSDSDRHDDGSTGGDFRTAPVNGKWWYRYTPRVRGTYLFQARFVGDNSRTDAISRTVSVTVR